MPVKKAFGGLTIKVDTAWKEICGPKREVSPTEMTKLLWAYIKKHKLMTKGAGKQFGGMVIKADPALAVMMGDLFGPGMKHQAERPVSDVMGPIKVTVNAEDSLAKALFLMVQEGVGMMPVLDNQRVVGMVRLTDLFLEISQFLLGGETQE